MCSSDLPIIVRIDPRDVPSKGELVHARIRAGEQHNFAASTGMRLPN